ncbi:MAG: hypothetical protein GX610_15585 [Rhodococcus sp.]|nr:hypothetical protein [Rhodococcus sp. (in: high G+C Gram-positive bacteria)]
MAGSAVTGFAGTTVLAGLGLRTDRARIAAWSIAIAVAGFLLASQTSTANASTELAAVLSVLVAVMAVHLVTPHLRGAEQSGRLELANTGIVGRWAPLTGGLSAAVTAIVCTSALLVVALESAGSGFAGSARLAAGTLVVGLVFASLAALVCQYVDDAAAANGLSLVAIAAAGLLRTVGPAPDGAGVGLLGWLSPFAWSSEVGSVESPQWWPLFIGVIVVVALLAVTYWAVGRRDLGVGARRRTGGGEPRHTGPLPLVLRERQWSLISWNSGVLGVCLATGALVGQAPEFTGTGADFETSSGLFLVLVALLSAGYTVIAVQRIVLDEESGATDAILSVPLSRSGWFRTQIMVTAGAATCLTLIGGIGFAIAAASARSDAGAAWNLLVATLHVLPALAVIIGMAAWCYGHAPRAVNGLWVYLAYISVIAMFGDDLPVWAAILSPFAQLPLLPAEPFAVGPPIALAAIGAVLTILGAEGFRRRDIAYPSVPA